MPRQEQGTAKKNPLGIHGQAYKAFRKEGNLVGQEKRISDAVSNIMKGPAKKQLRPDAFAATMKNVKTLFLIAQKDRLSPDITSALRDTMNHMMANATPEQRQAYYASQQPTIKIKTPVKTMQKGM